MAHYPNISCMGIEDSVKVYYDNFINWSIEMRVSNKNCRELVINRRDFTANNIFGETNGRGVYAVYSYGYHFPLYANINGQWYGNADKYSVSTSRHYSQANPLVPVIMVSTNELKSMI